VRFGSGWSVIVPKSGVEVGAGNNVARPLVAVPRLCGENALIGTSRRVGTSALRNARQYYIQRLCMYELLLSSW
jgi:hypothetical protein